MKELFITGETVKAHMKHIMAKLDANDRTQTLAIALRRGVIQSPDSPKSPDSSPFASL
jgi:DNA-binding CsgD family transcriptional regulator